MEKEWSLLPDEAARAVEFSQRIGTTPSIRRSSRFMIRS